MPSQSVLPECLAYLLIYLCSAHLASNDTPWTSRQLYRIVYFSVIKRVRNAPHLKGWPLAGDIARLHFTISQAYLVHGSRG